jgi:hypothetical protein
MFSPVEFFIGITDGQKNIDAIHVKLDHSMSLADFQDLISFLNTDTSELISDINASQLGSPAFSRIQLKIDELANRLSANVVMDLNLENYGVDVDYQDIGIPVPLENPVLVIDLFRNHHTRIYSDEFESVLYDYLVGASG